MEIKDLKDFKQFFLDKRKELLLELKEIELDIDGDDTDKIQGQIIGNTIKALSLLNNKKINLINLALERIEAGTFGICEECECKIGIKRLMARPEATLCISCAEKLELNAKFFSKTKKVSEESEEQ